MAVKSKEEIIAQIRAKLGDDTSDDAIALIEDVTDTYGALTEKNGDGKDWKAEAERIDKEWREKYVSRFSKGSDEEDDNNEANNNTNKPLTFEDLFSKGE